MVGWASAAPVADAPKYDFNIPSGTVSEELTKVFQLTHTEMIFDGPMDMPGQGVSGRYTVEEAVARILWFTGAGCEHAKRGHGLLIRSATRRRMLDRCLNPETHPLSEIQGPTLLVKESMDVIDVKGTNVGTHLHGIPQIGSTVITWDEDQIRRSGAHRLPDLIAKLTENFRGGPNQQTHTGQSETATNTGLGSSANLRGLGARATLVLINGRRVASSGSAASFVDLEQIPLSAVESIEVLLDGASAFYGSDAVGGVIDIRTKDNYTRPETFAEIGSVTDGRQEQHRLSQDLGYRWDGGHLTVVGEILHRGALAANERWQDSSDLRPRGPNEGSPYAIPGSLQVPPAQAVYPIPALGSGDSIDFPSLLAGTPNLMNRYAGSNIVPNQTLSSLSASLRQDVGSTVTVFSDFLWTQRYALERQGGQAVNLNVTNSPFLSNPPPTEVIEQYNLLDLLGPQVGAVNVRTLNVALGLQVDLPHDWHMVLSGSEAVESENQVTSGQANPAVLQAAVAAGALNPFVPDPTTVASSLPGIPMQQWYGSRSQLWDFAATADGPFLALPAGPIHEALGVEYRDQRFSSEISQTDTSSDLRRQVFAGFGEVAAPLLNDTTFPAPWRDLTLSLAGRIESNSDFGSAATPRVGLTWEPIPRLALRGTWAKSVRAPNLEDLVEKTNASWVQSVGDEPALIWTGGNAKLHVERALTRTLGLTFKSEGDVPRFTMDLDYFDILFRNRIQPSAFPADILSDPVYSSFVTHVPSAAARENVCNRSIYVPVKTESCLQLPINAIVDLRARNSATLWTDGIDARLGSNVETSLGKFGFSLAGTYILHYKQADTPDAPLVSLLNTLSNPQVLHIIGSTHWTIGNAETSLDVQYANRYRDTETSPVSSIASWTTADLRIAYTFGADDAPRSRPVEVALNCENLFNRYSPFAVNTIASLGYDQENGSLTGRVITLAVDVKW